MKYSILILVLFLCSPSLFSQENIDVRQEIAALKMENKFFKARLISIDKSFYDVEKKKLEIAIILGVKMSEKWNNLQNNISISKGLNRITQINSIGKSNALGLNFDATIQEMIDKNLVVSFAEAPEVSQASQSNAKSRWKTIVHRILNNEVVQSFVKSNPFTSIANSLINSAIGFTSYDVATHADIKLVTVGEELPKKYKHYRNEWKTKYDIIGATTVKSMAHTNNVISDEALLGFSDAIKPYISLYNQMAASNLKFQIQIQEVSNSFVDYKDVISTYDTALLRSLNIVNLSDLPSRLSGLTYVALDSSFPAYREVIEKPELAAARGLANQYTILRKKVNALNIRFYDVHTKHFKAYIKHLNDALILTEGGKTNFDKVKILQSIRFLEQQLITSEKAKHQLLPKE
ncbi:MAG: hypothetical protein COB98_04685 [Flavobacteriaceae bacterium]|nr:MAG: hypothetical protein COB98_04685 [Flavobacteriaceae bacterium]